MSATPKRPNPGWFKKGHDPRRRPLTKADCRKGYLIATRLAKMPSRTRAWLRNKISRYYRGR
jgi:hypothetical protein